jgi:hypothetical protein
MQDTVLQTQNAIRALSNFHIVSDNHKSDTLVFGETRHEVEYRPRCATIQVSGGLIG